MRRWTSVEKVLCSKKKVNNAWFFVKIVIPKQGIKFGSLAVTEKDLRISVECFLFIRNTSVQ